MPVQNWSQITVQQLPEAKRKLEIRTVGTLSTPYTFTHSTPLRTIDVSTATLTDALNCLAAIVADLKTAGILPP